MITADLLLLVTAFAFLAGYVLGLVMGRREPR